MTTGGEHQGIETVRSRYEKLSNEELNKATVALILRLMQLPGHVGGCMEVRCADISAVVKSSSEVSKRFDVNAGVHHGVRGLPCPWVSMGGAVSLPAGWGHVNDGHCIWYMGGLSCGNRFWEK